MRINIPFFPLKSQSLAVFVLKTVGTMRIIFTVPPLYIRR